MVEGFGIDTDGDRQAEEAAGRGAERARVVRVRRARREGETGGAGRLGDARQGADVAGVLQPFEIEIGSAAADGQRIEAGPGEMGDGEDALRRIGIRDILQELRRDLQGRGGEPADERGAFRGGEVERRDENGFEEKPGGKSFRHEMRAFQDGVIAFTSPEAPNILEPLVLTAGDHDQRP